MKEYRVLYIINGQGFTTEDSWTDCVTEDEDVAKEALSTLTEHNTRFDSSEQWIEVREVSDWQRYV